LAARVAGVVGPEHVLRDADVKATYETDWTRRYSGSARFVVRPSDTAELAESLRILAESGAPVVPQAETRAWLAAASRAARSRGEHDAACFA